MVTQPQIHGDVDERFGRVADVFRDNFTSRGEVGAAVTVYVRGRKVVDLYGGVADTRTGRPWDAHTPVVVFSCTKGILAICAYLLVQQGRLDLDAPVAATGRSSDSTARRTSRCAGCSRTRPACPRWTAR